ncbi:MAG: response regulator transcription factor [Pseudomonadota bacterium]
MRVLVIEDDLEQSGFIKKVLADAGHDVVTADDGETGLAEARGSEFDALVVDRMLPEKPGLRLVEEFRNGGGTTPALFLSALSDVDNRVEGLKAGADDYLAKPFAPEELLARVEALGRRQTSGEPPVTNLKVGDLEMDLLSRRVMRGETKIDLQPREFKLLEYLMRHAGQTVTRTMLLEGVWNYHFDPQTNVIDVHISRLRAKIDKEFDTQLLQTVRGAGYCLTA